jgi:hypothetical protein
VCVCVCVCVCVSYYLCVLLLCIHYNNSLYICRMDSPTRLKIDALIRYGALGILSQEEVVSRSRAILEEFDNPSQGVRGDASMQPDVEARVALMCF